MDQAAYDAFFGILGKKGEQRYEYRGAKIRAETRHDEQRLVKTARKAWQ